MPTDLPHDLLAQVDHEVFLLTARHEQRESGMIITWILPATLVPDRPRVIIVPSPCNFTHELMRASRRFLVHLLAEDQAELLPRFGLYSGRDRNKFEGMKLERTKTGLPIIPNCCGWIECQIISEQDLGDRIVTVADVIDQFVDPSRKPLSKSAAFARQPAAIQQALWEKRLRDGERDKKLIRK